MAETTTIDELPNISAVDAGTLFLVEEGGETYNATGAQLKAFLTILGGDGNYYLTPFLRYTPTQPPLEQALAGGVWVTIRTIS